MRSFNRQDQIAGKSSGSRRAVARCALAFGLLMGLWLAAAPARAQEELFGATATRSDNMASFPKWTGVLQRYFGGTDPVSRVCKGDVFRRCMSEEWKGFLEEIGREDKATQIRRVNERMNRARYTVDMSNYGEADYWATPVQFFKMDGDCEDYAISKYLSLRALGFDDEQLRIVILTDMNLRVAHAILVVTFNGTPYVLDNQIAQAVPASIIRHYKPIYSLNEKSWWLYRPKPAGS
jgi:predicted transglutaminase-like cysteine proteinase